MSRLWTNARIATLDPSQSGLGIIECGAILADGERIAWLHARGEVLDQSLDKNEMQLSVRLSPDNWARFQALEST